MSIKGLHHVSITVKDFEATVAFYTQGFGFKKGDVWARGENGHAVMLDMGDGSFLEVFSGAEKAVQESGIFAHIALSTDDCDGDFQRAVAAGAEVQMEPTDVMLPSDPPAPIRIAFCKGPNGEVFEFFQHE